MPCDPGPWSGHGVLFLELAYGGRGKGLLWNISKSTAASSPPRLPGRLWPNRRASPAWETVGGKGNGIPLPGMPQAADWPWAAHSYQALPKVPAAFQAALAVSQRMDQ